MYFTYGILLKLLDFTPFPSPFTMSLQGLWSQITALLNFTVKTWEMGFSVNKYTCWFAMVLLLLRVIDLVSVSLQRWIIVVVTYFEYYLFIPWKWKPELGLMCCVHMTHEYIAVPLIGHLHIINCWVSIPCKQWCPFMLDFYFSQCTLCPCNFLPGMGFSRERGLLEMVRVLVGVIGEQEKQECLALKSIALGSPVFILVVISFVSSQSRWLSRKPYSLLSDSGRPSEKNICTMV